MVRAIEWVGSDHSVVDVPGLPSCPSWCDSNGERVCWVSDADQGWVALHMRYFGLGVSVVLAEEWTPDAGAVAARPHAECSLWGLNDDWVGDVREVRVLVDVLSEAAELLESINTV
jgi:hypothetical protein